MSKLNRFLVLLLFTALSSLFSYSAFSQTLYPYCKDSLVTPNSYLQCPVDYHPVCACDGKTYRNDCAAEGWGAIYPGNWTDGSCSFFDFDIYPTVITPDPNQYGRLSIYMRNPGTATVLIYSSYGRLMFQKLFSTNDSGKKISTADPYSLYEPQGFPTGIYLLVVTVGGDKQSKKFFVIQR